MLGQLTLKALCASLLLCSLSAFAQTGATHPPSTVPALLISDIHLDPFHDPSKVARLNLAPESQWAAIFALPDSPSQAAQSAELQKTCPVRGTDTNDVLWQSSLRAIHTQAVTTHPRFVTISGDLLSHAFDCKYKTLRPSATHADYVSFTRKTIRYIALTLRAAVPETPIYLALGNNDSGCGDYQLSSTHDDHIAAAARIAAEFLPAADRASLLATFTDTGSYSVPLAGVPNTRLIVLDDLYQSARYTTCSGSSDPAPAKAQNAWLAAQLDDARAHHQHVWVMGHIPPGVDLYSSARKLLTICTGGQPVLFLSSDALAQTLADHADVVALAIFAHTHSDEMHFIPAKDTPNNADHPGVPVKLISSISPVNGNRPTFTIAHVDTATSALGDYTVYMASNLTGINATWSKEYTYSEAYHQPAYNAAAAASLITGFQADPTASTPASQAYMRNFFPGDISPILKLAWPQYACSMNRTSPESFVACVCPAHTP